MKNAFTLMSENRWWILVFSLAGIFPLIVQQPYFIHVAALFLMYSILAMGLSIVVSFAGLLDLGFVAFFAVGAYFYAIFNSKFGLPFMVALPTAGVLAAGAGVLLGFPTLRVRGDYLALVTLAFGEMVRQVLQNWSSVTGGPRGISAIEGPQFFGVKASLPWQYYLIVLVVAIFCVVLLHKLKFSPLAQVWASIRDEETAAQCCGIHSTRWLLLAFAIGASFAGVVGVFFAAIQRFVSPESFVLDESILILSIVVLARGRSVARLFFATAILFGLPEILRGIEQYRTLVFGVLLVAFTILDHIFSERKKIIEKFSTQSDSKSSAVPVTFPESLGPDGERLKRMVVKKVTKRYSGLLALDSISFEANFSDGIVALVGPNGAGKTTLFNCISSLEKVDSGIIQFDTIGYVSNMSPHFVAKAGVARTFQKVRLFDTMTVRENIAIGTFPRIKLPVVASIVPGVGLDPYIHDVDLIVNTALTFLGLQSIAEKNVRTLPIGFRRKIEIARALVSRPRVLLLDEVGSGLNDKEKTDLAHILRLISSNGGISILLVEHDMKFIRELADSVIVLDSGKILDQGLPSKVMNNPLVIDSYLGTHGGFHADGE
jgi:branched-chain amino acid transport system permease protein